MDVTGVLEDVEALLDRSIAPTPYVLPPEADEVEPIDIGQLDFDRLKERFEARRSMSPSAVPTGSAL